MVRKYGKRQRFGNRYVARNASGEFISNVDVGRSLAQDRARKAIRKVGSGFGGLGDAKRAENLAVADVEIHDGMNIPAGSGAIVGQAIPETDFTPFGVSAEGYDDKLDESLGMSRRESKMKQSRKARRDESKGTEKYDGARAYSRVGTMDKNADGTMDKNADDFENAVGGFYPTGDGRAFGSMTLHDTYAPLAAAEGDVTSGFKMGMGATLGVIGGLAFAGWIGGMMSSLAGKTE